MTKLPSIVLASARVGASIGSMVMVMRGLPRIAPIVADRVAAHRPNAISPQSGYLVDRLID